MFNAASVNTTRLDQFLPHKAKGFGPQFCLKVCELNSSIWGLSAETQRWTIKLFNMGFFYGQKLLE